MNDLFRHERSTTGLDERLVFLQRFLDIERDLGWEKASAARIAGCVIRWLEDLVESPPRRPGTTPEERADDLAMGKCHFAEVLKALNHEFRRHTQGAFLYDSLPRPAQSAWGRLVITHLPHLPLPARLALYNTADSLSNNETHRNIAAEGIFDALDVLESGKVTADAGCGIRRCVVPEILQTLRGNLLHNPKCPPLFASEPRGSDVLLRRLTLSFYYDLIYMRYDMRRRAFRFADTHLSVRPAENVISIVL
jgi:hypothetical protein